MSIVISHKVTLPSCLVKFQLLIVLPAQYNGRNNTLSELSEMRKLKILVDVLGVLKVKYTDILHKVNNTKAFILTVYA